MSKGAEADVFLLTKGSERAILKERKPKPYRDPSLDERIRELRTKQEASLLKKASQKLRVPKLLHRERFSLLLEFIEGKRPEKTPELAAIMGELLRELHSLNIIHNDFTPANVLLAEEPVIIDFGLGFHSSRIEDKANDVFTTAYSLDDYAEAFLAAYKDERVLARVEEIRKRARYVR